MMSKGIRLRKLITISLALGAVALWLVTAQTGAAPVPSRGREQRAWFAANGNERGPRERFKRTIPWGQK